MFPCSYNWQVFPSVATLQTLEFQFVIGLVWSLERHSGHIIRTPVLAVRSTPRNVVANRGSRDKVRLQNTCAQKRRLRTERIAAGVKGEMNRL